MSLVIHLFRKSVLDACCKMIHDSLDLAHASSVDQIHASLSMCLFYLLLSLFNALIIEEIFSRYFINRNSSEY